MAVGAAVKLGDLARVPHCRASVHARAAVPAEGRARARDRAGAARRRLHPRLPAVGRAVSPARSSRAGHDHAADRVARARPATRRSTPRRRADRRHGRRRDLGALCALHRRRRRRDRRHPHRAAGRCRPWSARSRPSRAACRQARRGVGRHGRSPERTDRDLPAASSSAASSTVVAGRRPRARRVRGRHGRRCNARCCAVGVGVFGVLFVTVAARIVGIVGVSSQPTSGITLVTLLGTASVFAAAGWIDPGCARRGAHRRHDRRGRGLARRATSRRT